jgi:alpha-N-arabinofuranosidase
LPGNWSNKGPALGFDEDAWFTTLRKAGDIDRVLARHIAIMDQYDPRGRVGLMVDEWGTWYDPMEGTNPAFLKQQNSLRDALVAGVTLNIFHDHAERVRMANIAQTVNVLQAMIHTDGPDMFVTPTYHVFEMYKVHQDAMRLASHLDSPEYQFGNSGISAVNASASKDENGAIHISLCNLNPNESVNLVAEIRGMNTKRLAGRVLTADAMDAHNNFENKNRVEPTDLDDLKSTRNGFTTTLPPKSVVVIEVR